MNFIIQLIIFFLIVFIYLHIRFQLKVNKNLEVYEIDYETNEALQKVCDIKSPVVFNARHQNIGFTEIPSELTEEQKVVTELNVIDTTDGSKVSMSYNAANVLVDANEKYYSENNQDFLIKSKLIDYYKRNDALLCSPLIVERKYDMMIGNKGTMIRTQYHTADRKYLYVESGGVIKIILGLSCEEVDREDENRTITVTVLEGNIISIPSYWYYKIKFEEKSKLQVYEYKSVINKVIFGVNKVMVGIFRDCMI